jgi:DNA-binding transcriptional LysR family regulator
LSSPEIPWSDLRLVLAIRRGGSLRAAAQALRISHPTVSRRVHDLEDQLGVHLLRRNGRQLELTPAGEDLADTAERVEREVDGLGRRIAGRDHRLEGVVRVAMSPAMLAAVARHLPDFRRRHPGVQLDLTTNLGFASLSRREADVAVRQTNAPHDTLVGRRLSLFEQAVYAHRGLVKDGPARQWPWIDWDDAHRHHSSARWVAEHVDPGSVVVRCETSLAMYQLVRAGVGVGFVPTMLAHPNPEVVRLDADVFPVFHRGIWVLTHADLRTMGRVRATVTWLGDLLHVDGGGVWRGTPSTAG